MLVREREVLRREGGAVVGIHLPQLRQAAPEQDLRLPNLAQTQTKKAQVTIRTKIRNIFNLAFLPQREFFAPKSSTVCRSA